MTSKKSTGRVKNPNPPQPAEQISVRIKAGSPGEPDALPVSPETPEPTGSPVDELGSED